MIDGFIGKGLAYPLQEGSDGSLAIVDEEAKISTNLLFLLSLKYNTVPGMEDVGSDLPSSLFEKLRDPSFLIDGVRKLLTTFEKRVIIEDIQMDRLDQVFKLKITYRIRGLGVTKDIEALVGGS